MCERFIKDISNFFLQHFMRHLFISFTNGDVYDDIWIRQKNAFTA